MDETRQEELKRLMKEVGWSSMQLSIATGRSYSTVRNWVTTKKPHHVPLFVLETLRKAASVYKGLTPYEVWGLMQDGLTPEEQPAPEAMPIPAPEANETPQQELNRLLAQIGWTERDLVNRINRKHATVYKWCNHWKPPAIPEVVLVRLRQIAAGETPAADTDEGKWLVPVSRGPVPFSCNLIPTLLGRPPMGRPAPKFTLVMEGDNTSSSPTLSNVTITRDYID